MRHRCRRHTALLLCKALALLGALAVPTLGWASVAWGADEEPRRLTPTDAAIVESIYGTRIDSSAGTPVFDVLRAPGVLRSQGVGGPPTGPLGLVTYTLEEVTIPPGAVAPIFGTRTPPASAFRITVVGGPFRVGAISPTIWIGDTPLRHTALDFSQTQVSALVPDPSVLVNGAPLAVTYGTPPEAEDRLRETLSVPPGLR